jgi:hypothetical protein
MSRQFDEQLQASTFAAWADVLRFIAWYQQAEYTTALDDFRAREAVELVRLHELAPEDKPCSDTKAQPPKN